MAIEQELAPVEPQPESDSAKLARLGQELSAKLAQGETVDPESFKVLAELNAKVLAARTLTAISLVLLSKVWPQTPDFRNYVRDAMREHHVTSWNLAVTLGDGDDATLSATFSLGSAVGKVSTSKTKGDTTATSAVKVRVHQNGTAGSTEHASKADAIRAYESDDEAKRLLAPNHYNSATFEAWLKRMAERGYSVTTI